MKLKQLITGYVEEALTPVEAQARIDEVLYTIGQLQNKLDKHNEAEADLGIEAEAI
ncbi:hypothetical protein [Enterovibrio baiacu]|uniref:hypothetical protein n=1 Tax=Enterovibrio baiacu TaxID=2491023 RepID=UPI001386AEEA|nr:hypothetical protein [Enterovibrio baiacu]